MKIALSNTTFKVGPVEILQDVSFQLMPDSFYCLVGPNGSGKSTVLKLIMNILEVDSGTIDTISPVNISYLPQNLADPPFLTVSEVINVAIKQGSKDRNLIGQDLQYLAEQFRLHHLLDRKCSDISAGEKQRIWLAFAMALKKDVIVMDESLSSIDRNSREEFFKLLKTVSLDGKTLLLVTHDIEMAIAYADKIIALENGKVVFDGPSTDYKDQIEQISTYFINSQGSNRESSGSLTNQIDSNI